MKASLTNTTGESARRLTSDPVILLALVLAAVFCLNGIRWGRCEDWNPDQMALRSLSSSLRPNEFLKPPFHTFLDHLLVVWPLSLAQVAGRLITGHKQNYNELILLGSRLLTLAMCLGALWLAASIAEKFYGRNAARITALFFATSAGFFVYSHFLTVDTPVTFWMLLAAFFATRILFEPTRKNYLLAGFLTGLSTATKYNGLAVGLAIPVAHLLTQPWSWRAFLPDKKLLLGLLMVPAGFVAGNPHAIFSWRKFSSDFAYNYTITPRYGGETGHGFGQFLEGIFDLLGQPGSLVIFALVLLSALLLVRRKALDLSSKCWLVLASVFLLYFVKFGSDPRVPTRFVLPAVPFLLLLSGPALQLRWLRSRWLWLILLPLFTYNAICSWYVGQRFRDDPRMDAQLWVEKHIPPGSRLESSSGSPHWATMPRLDAVELKAEAPNFNKLHGRQIPDLRMPRPNTLRENFSRIFAGDDAFLAEVRRREKTPEQALFSSEKLAERNPDFVTWYSGDSEPEIPFIREYYSELLTGRYPYKIAFDQDTPAVPHWVYPRLIDFLGRRMVILDRAEGKTTR